MEAKRIGAARLFDTTKHARERMEQEDVAVADVACALASATAAKFQSRERTWRISGGKTLDGDGLVVVLALGWAPRVVTVWR